MKRRIMHSLTIKEVSGVDVPAQEGARMLIAKRREPIDKFDNGFTNPKATNEVDGHQHLLDDSGRSGMTTWEKSEGEESSHEHSWIRNDDGSIDILVSEGHDHEILTKRAGDGDATNKTKELVMTKQEVTQEQFDKSEARAERAEKMAELTDAQKTHLEKLDEKKQEAFLQLDKDGRQREVEKTTAGDPVVYTSPRTKREYRKSGDPEVLEAVKSADEAWEIAKSERDLRIDGDLQKRADALGNIPGEADVKKALLKAIDGIEDEELRKGALKIVTAANSELSKSFDRRGTEGGLSGGTVGDAEAHYEMLAQDFAKANECTIEKARAEVLLTDEGADLYADMTTTPVAID